MNIQTLTRSQLLALGLLLAVLLVFFIFIAKPVAGHYLNNRAEIIRLEHEIEVYERVAANLPEDQLKLEEMRANNPVQDLHFQEPRPSLATASLQQHLNRIVGRAGGQVVSTKIIQSNEDAALPPVAIEVHIRCEVPELVALLHALESGKPLLFIDNLIVASTNARGERVQRESRTRRSTRPQRASVAALDVRFELIGYGAKENI